MLNLTRDLMKPDQTEKIIPGNPQNAPATLLPFTVKEVFRAKGGRRRVYARI